MPKKVLIVDDDYDLVEAVSLLLKEKNIEPIPAYGGVSGLAKAKSESPDLIVLDVMMPDKDGYAVARELAKDETLSGIPVIMLTGVIDHISDSSYSHDDGKSLVADDFIPKPFDPPILINRILELLH